MRIVRSEAHRNDTIAPYLAPIQVGSEIVVEEGDSAVLFQERAVIGTLGPGRHTLRVDDDLFLPVAGDTVAAKVAFVSRAPRHAPRGAFPALVTDPRSGRSVTVGVAGTWTVRVVDPSRCVAELPTIPGDGILEAATTCHLARSVARHLGRGGDLLEATTQPAEVLARGIAEAARPIMAEAGLELVEARDVRLSLDSATRASLAQASELETRQGICARCGDPVPLGPLCLCGGPLFVICPGCGDEHPGELELCPTCGYAP